MTFKTIGVRVKKETVNKINSIREKMIVKGKKTDSKLIRSCIDYAYANLDKFQEFQIREFKGV